VESLTFKATDATQIHYYRWLPADEPIATIQIAHGMGEHAARYDWLAGQLTAAGYAVYAQDHRGHGQTAAEGGLGDLGEDGWNRVISDAAELHDLITSAVADRPRILLGHSMGAMLAQQYLYRFGEGLDAAVISGSPGLGTPIQMWLSHTLARFEAWRLGFSGESALLDKMIFGNANDDFAATENATGFEWLSRDTDQVNAYAADPLCGFVLRTGSLVNLFAGAREARKRKNIERIPADLPIYIFSGSADPVHSEEKGLDRLLKRYRAQVRKVDYRLYRDGRHEMFNELNRNEVVGDLLKWLELVLPARSSPA